MKNNKIEEFFQKQLKTIIKTFLTNSIDPPNHNFKKLKLLIIPIILLLKGKLTKIATKAIKSNIKFKHLCLMEILR
jgi:hypothetical protein